MLTMLETPFKLVREFLPPHAIIWALCELAAPLPPFHNEWNKQLEFPDVDDEELSDKG